jgi:hypothetical protein
MVLNLTELATTDKTHADPAVLEQPITIRDEADQLHQELDRSFVVWQLTDKKQRWMT